MDPKSEETLAPLRASVKEQVIFQPYGYTSIVSTSNLTFIIQSRPRSFLWQLIVDDDFFSYNFSIFPNYTFIFFFFNEIS